MSSIALRTVSGKEDMKGFFSVANKLVPSEQRAFVLKHLSADLKQD
jgi:hypothetical protein